ncbi:MAG: alpha/beta fold hydrolase [Sorangiineae bacterium PRO1]|nr:alpha/beta fold hydrolase [Sorangiineae bacterium PRO1]
MLRAMSDRFPVQPGAEPWSSPGSGSRSGIGVVLCHGFTGNPTATRPLGEALAARGFAVEVIRLPGHGTHWRDMLATRYGDWRWEMDRALSDLAGRGKRVVLVGLSMGGTIALDVACARPELVAGVVPINCTLLNRAGFLAKAAPVLEHVLPVVPAAAAGLVKNDIAKGGDEHAYEMVPAKAGNSFLKQLPRIRLGLETLKVPVLVAYSPQDHSVPAENSRALLKMLEGRDVTELVLPRSYHLATLDHDFDLLVDEIAGFAERVGTLS